jgi:hypothetical protein
MAETLIIDAEGNHVWYQPPEHGDDEFAAVDWDRCRIIETTDSYVAIIVDDDDYDHLPCRLHRDDGGSAVIWADGTREWWVDGACHREADPAVISADGSKAWYRRGKLHREGGAAIIYEDGSQSWWIDDELHRDDGPAVRGADGHDAWWRHGRNLTAKVEAWSAENAFPPFDQWTEAQQVHFMLWYPDQ